MSDPDDFEAYQKGYEDAVRAAGTPVVSKPVARRTKRKRGGSSRFQAEIGYLIGTLVAFPLLVGLVFGLVAAAVGGGGSAEAWFVFTAGCAFLFGSLVIVRYACGSTHGRSSSVPSWYLPS